MTNYEIKCQRDSAATQFIDGKLSIVPPDTPRFYSTKGLWIESVKTNHIPSQVLSNPPEGSDFTMSYVEDSDFAGMRLYSINKNITYNWHPSTVRTAALSPGKYTASVWATEGVDVRAYLNGGELPKIGITMRADSSHPAIEGLKRYVCEFSVTDARNLADIRIGSYSGPFNLKCACPQIEKGGLVTSYIPTTGSAVTRDRDYYQIKDLPTAGLFVYHFHWEGSNTEHGRFEILAYENPTRRDDYRLVRLWEDGSGRRQALTWNTAYAETAVNKDSGIESVINFQGWRDGVRIRADKTTTGPSLNIRPSGTHGQLVIRGTIDIPGDDPEDESYSYFINHLAIYDKALNTTDTDNIDTNLSDPLLSANLETNLTATRRGYAWVPDFKGAGSMSVPAWAPVGGDADFGDCEIDIFFKLDTLTKTQYLFDSRKDNAGSKYCYYSSVTNKIEHNLGGDCTVNGVTYSNFVFENTTDTYHLILSNVRKPDVVLNQVGSSYTGVEELDGKILSIRLRDMQYDVNDVDGSGNRSRYYDFVQWTDSTTAPTNNNIPDAWNTGENTGTLTGCTWVRL